MLATWSSVTNWQSLEFAWRSFSCYVCLSNLAIDLSPRNQQEQEVSLLADAPLQIHETHKGDFAGDCSTHAFRWVPC